jgi:DivIVA domain-containing protein
MPSSDLDMPLLPSSEQIRRREFATVRRGYDPQQVRAYLTSIANQVGTLERELSQLRLEAGSAAARTETAVTAVGGAPAEQSPAPDPYDALSKRFATLIEMADQEAEHILSNARSEAQRTVDEARSEADRIRVDAQARAEEARQEGTDLLDHAREESDRVLSGLADRRRGLVTQLEEMRTTLLAVVDDLAIPLEEAEGMDVANELADDEPDVTSAVDAGAPAIVAEDAPVDPRYEDLWVSKEDAIDIPDLASIDLDFDDRDESPG